MNDFPQLYINVNYTFQSLYYCLYKFVIDFKYFGIFDKLQ